MIPMIAMSTPWCWRNEGMDDHEQANDLTMKATEMGHRAGAGNAMY